MTIATGSSLVELNLAAAEAGGTWVHLMPAGTFSGRDGRGPYVLSDPEKVIAASQAARMDLVVDYDHQTDLAAVRGVGGTAPAAGWLKELQARADGIWGLVEWTASAGQKVEGREYRFLSPVFTHSKETGEVFAIKRAALTNNPNLQLTALAAQDGVEAGSGEAGLAERIAEALGLDDIGEDAILRAISELVGAVRGNGDATATAGAQETGIMELAAELNRVKSQRAEERATTLVESAVTSGRLPPYLRDWGLALCRENPDRFEEFAAQMAPIVAPGTQADTVAMHSVLSRRTRRASPDEQAILDRMGVSAETYNRYGSGRE